MKEYRPVKEGKVREIYDTEDGLIMVATDRISAFDNILKNDVTGKGKVLTQMSKFWFDFTGHIVDNHMKSTDVNDMPEFFRNEKFAGRSMLCKKLNMLPVECIVRGYITSCLALWNRRSFLNLYILRAPKLTLEITMKTSHTNRVWT